MFLTFLGTLFFKRKAAEKRNLNAKLRSIFHFYLYPSPLPSWSFYQK